MKFLTLGEKKPSEAIKADQPEKIAKYMSDISNLDRESLWVIHLDRRLQILSREMVSLGSLGGSIATAREIFRGAIVKNSAAMILVHNHPSGDPSPSPEDYAVTKTMVAAAKLLGIDFLDHLIIGANKFYSFQKKGEI